MVDNIRGKMRFFSEDTPALHRNSAYQLTTSELVGLNSKEKNLIKSMIEAYRGGIIMGIESYSGGCPYKQSKIQQILEKHKPSEKYASKPEREAFVFSMYSASSASKKFISSHHIKLDNSHSDGLKEIARYFYGLANGIPESAAFYSAASEFDAQDRFGFTLIDQAARAMHKVNDAMNPRCRGFGD
jgi:hypothetical protein